MRLRLSIFLAFIAALSLGCATFAEPKTGTESLVIAKPSYVASGMPWAFVNGKTSRGLTVWIYHIESKKAFSKPTNASGMVTFSGIPEGQYALVQMEVKVSDSRTTWTSWVEPKGPGYVFEVAQGQVVNLGGVVWSEVYEKFSGGSSTGSETSTQISTKSEVQVGADYDAVKELFQKSNAKSKWNDMSWVNAEFH